MKEGRAWSLEKARLKVDDILHIKPRIEVFCNWLSLCRAFSASPSFLRLPRAALRAETGLRLP